MMHKKIYRIAQKAARKSKHPIYQMGCVIFKRNDILSYGYNQLKTHPKSPAYHNYIHAEFHALLNLHGNNLNGCEVFVYMQRKSGYIGMAKPCIHCEEMLRKLGIKRAYYTTPKTGIMWVDYE